MEVEKTIYQTSPSQIRNALPFLGAFFFIAAVFAAAIITVNNMVLLLLPVPLIYALWKWLEIRSTRLTVSTERLIITHGVLNRTTNETELYRLRDTCVEEPWHYRLFGLGRIIVYTTDEDKPMHTFNGYAKPHWLKDQIRNSAEICRQKKRWGMDSILLHDRGFQ